MRGHPEIEDVVGSVTSFCTCQVLRPRRAVRALALTCPYVLPSAFGVGAQGMNLYEAQWLAYALPYRRFAAVFTDCDARSGPIWIATPSSYRTCTDCSLLVSRRTAKDSVRHLWKRISACRSRSFLISMRATIRCIRFQGGDEADFVARGWR